MTDHQARTLAVSRQAIPRHHAVTNMDLDVTEGCNLGCIYCFKGELPGPVMSLETAKDSVRWLLEASGSASRVNVNFMGGEPTMNWKMIRQLVPWARRRGKSLNKLVTFSMTSNLVLWTDEIRSMVDQYGFGILMSIDGCPDVQDAQRPSKNGKKVSGTIEHWAKSLLRTRPKSQARATVHPAYVHRFHESMTYLHSIGFLEVAVAHTNYADWTDEHMSTLASQMDAILDYIAACYLQKRPFNLTVLKYYIHHLVHPRAEAMPVTRRGQPCGAGKGYLMVDHRGDVWPCHRFDGADADAKLGGQMKMGNIYKPDFKQEMQEAFLSFDHFKYHKERCNTCPVNEICGGFCPAANLSATGNIYTPHERFCDWSSVMYDQATKLYERLKPHADAFALLVEDCRGSDTDGQR